MLKLTATSNGLTPTDITQLMPYVGTTNITHFVDSSGTAHPKGSLFCLGYTAGDGSVEAIFDKPVPGFALPEADYSFFGDWGIGG